MKNSIFVSELSAVFERELRELSTGSAHTFSEGFDKKMSSLINAFPSRIKMTLSRHRKRAAVTAAAAAAVILLSPALWAVINIIALSMFGLDSTASSIPDEEHYAIFYDPPYYIYTVYDYNCPPSFFDYNYFPDMSGKVHYEPDLSVEHKSAADGRAFSDGIVIVNISDEGELRETAYGEFLYTKARVLYDITDKYNELYKEKEIVIKMDPRVDFMSGSDDFRFEMGRDMLVMLTKVGESEYSPTLSINSCYYTDIEYFTGNADDITVTSISDDRTCAKYDGLPLGMLVYDMLNKPDIYEDTQKQSSPG